MSRQEALGRVPLPRALDAMLIGAAGKVAAAKTEKIVERPHAPGKPRSAGGALHAVIAPAT